MASPQMFRHEDIASASIHQAGGRPEIKVAEFFQDYARESFRGPLDMRAIEQKFKSPKLRKPRNVGPAMRWIRASSARAWCSPRPPIAHTGTQTGQRAEKEHLM
jgi:hypothetical protein